MCLPACRQGTAPVTSRGHAGPGEDIVPPPVSRHVTTPLEFPTQADGWPLSPAPSPSPLWSACEGPRTQPGPLPMVTLPSPCLPQPPLLLLLLLSPSSLGCRWTSLPTGMLSGPPAERRASALQRGKWLAQEAQPARGGTNTAPGPHPLLVVFPNTAPPPSPPSPRARPSWPLQGDREGLELTDLFHRIVSRARGLDRQVELLGGHPHCPSALE